MFPALIRVLESGILDNTPTLTYLCQLLELASDTSKQPDEIIEELLLTDN